MAVNVRTITLWRAEVANQPGALSRMLHPLAEALLPGLLPLAKRLHRRYLILSQN